MDAGGCRSYIVVKLMRIFAMCLAAIVQLEQVLKVNTNSPSEEYKLKYMRAACSIFFVNSPMHSGLLVLPLNDQ